MGCGASKSETCPSAVSPAITAKKTGAEPRAAETTTTAAAVAASSSSSSSSTTTTTTTTAAADKSVQQWLRDELRIKSDLTTALTELNVGKVVDLAGLSPDQLRKLTKELKKPEKRRWDADAASKLAEVKDECKRSADTDRIDGN